MEANIFSEEADVVGGRAALLSIKPKYASMILNGTKTVELRRSWPSQEIGVLILYASSPIKKFVGLAYVEKIIECDLNELWSIANAHGGGVSYQELKSYMTGKSSAFGVIIKRVEVAGIALNPKEIIKDFVPPQSLSLISSSDFNLIVSYMFPREV